MKKRILVVSVLLFSIAAGFMVLSFSSSTLNAADSCLAGYKACYRAATSEAESWACHEGWVACKKSLEDQPR